MFAVDCHGHERAEVGPARDVRFPDLASEPCGFGDGFLAVLVGNAVLPDDDFGIDAGLVDRAEHLENASERAARRGRPARNLHRHHVAGLSAADEDRSGRGIDEGDRDVRQTQPVVERGDEMAADIELGLDFEDIPWRYLRHEGVGRRQCVFEIALADDLSIEWGG